MTPLLLCLVSGGDLPPQELHRTPDGSRFLLLPVPGPDLVHWALASPAGPMEEPVGMEGLSWAVLVASLYGTGTIGTLHAEREGVALRRIASLERVLASNPSDHRLALQLTAARMEAIGLRDPAAFRRVLAAAPATEVRVHRAPQAGLVLLSTVPDGLERVAELLRERREDNRLRAVDLALAGVRGEESGRPDDPMRPLRSEAVSLAFSGHAYAKAAPRDFGTAQSRRDAAWRVWQETQLPARCLHVLVGDFEPAAVRAILDRVFSRTTLVPGRPEPGAPPEWPSAIRKAAVPRSEVAGAVLALPAPDVGRATLRWAADLLAGGDESVLAQALRERGRPNVSVSWRGPIPDGLPGACLLVELQDADDSGDLGGDCLAALRRAAERLRDRPSLDAVRSRRRAEAHRITADPRALARWLATQLVHSSDPAAGARALLRGPSEEAVHSAALAAVEGTHPVVVESRSR